MSVDPDLKQRFAVDDKEPTTVIVIAVEQAFQHCPKAIVRSNLWKAGTGERPKGVSTLGDFAAARTPGIDSADYDADYARRSRTSFINDPLELETRCGSYSGRVMKLAEFGYADR